MLSKDKRKETILPRCCSEFSEKLELAFLHWGPFQSGIEREEVVLFVIVAYGIGFWVAR